MRDNLTGERSYVRNTLLQKRAAKLITPSLPVPVASESTSLSLPSKTYPSSPLLSSLPSSSSSSSLSLLDIISISSDDETDFVTCNPHIPIPTVPVSNTPVHLSKSPIPSLINQKRLLRQSPEVIIVLDSDEDNEDSEMMKKQRIGQAVKQEDEVKIKTERSASQAHMYTLPQQHKHQHKQRHVHPPFVDTVFHTSEDNESPKWPQDYYVCDVAKAFRDPPRGMSKKAAFQAYFPGLLFKKSTFYDNYNLWIRTPTNLCTKHVDYGHTPKGSWREFLDSRAQYLNK